MRMTKIVSLVIALIMLTACFVACNGGDDGKKSEKMTITMWVSDAEGLKGLTEQHVENFKKAKGYDFEIKIETVGEGDAAGQVLSDLKSAPDIYWFAGDQLPNLVRGKALAKPGVKATEEIRNNNDEESLIGATVDGDIYAYPLSSDNGYFLWYDKRYVSDSDAQTMEGIIAACEDSGKLFGFAVENAWIMTSFFFAQPVGSTTPLCTSTWTFNNNGQATGYTDTFNSDNGLIAMKAMNKLTSTEVWISEADKPTGTAAIVTGVWNRNTLRQVYGEANLGVAKLPTFTVDGNTYQLGSYKGCKYIGVKPQEDEKKAAICAELALYLSSYDRQMDRFYDYGWGPSNLEAKDDEYVQASPYLKALAAQNKYAQVQGVIPSGWWTPAALLGTASHSDENGTVTEATMKKALEDYAAMLDSLVVAE